MTIATIQPEDIATMLGYLIGDFVSWLTRWILILSIWTIRDAIVPGIRILAIVLVWLLWGLGTVTILLCRLLWLVVRLYMRLIATAGTLLSTLEIPPYTP